jgi:hypothetical protein
VKRLGEDEMSRRRAHHKLRRLYPVTIIGPDIWSQLPPMPAFDSMPTIDPVRGLGLDREGRVQIRAHQIVLELGGFVEMVQELFSGRRSHVEPQHHVVCHPTRAVKSATASAAPEAKLAIATRAEPARPVFLQRRNERLASFQCSRGLAAWHVEC